MNKNIDDAVLDQFLTEPLATIEDGEFSDAVLVEVAKSRWRAHLFMAGVFIAATIIFIIFFPVSLLTGPFTSLLSLEVVFILFGAAMLPFVSLFFITDH
jgi:ABC-type microcin C transport system permease subunit YejB